MGSVFTLHWLLSWVLSMILPFSWFFSVQSLIDPRPTGSFIWLLQMALGLSDHWPSPDAACFHFFEILRVSSSCSFSALFGLHESAQIVCGFLLGSGLMRLPVGNPGSGDDPPFTIPLRVLVLRHLVKISLFLTSLYTPSTLRSSFCILSYPVPVILLFFGPD